MGKNKSGTKRPRARGKASLDEVLGTAPGRGKVHRKWTEHHKRLTQLRNRFLGNKLTRSESAKEEVSTFSEHMADAATDSYDRDWALAMLSSDQNALYEIEQALKRIANATYGICELTGKPIEPERLRAIPWTRYSARAQAELEARGISGRTRLGQLGSYSESAEADESAGEEAEETMPPAEQKEAA